MSHPWARYQGPRWRLAGGLLAAAIIMVGVAHLSASVVVADLYAALALGILSWPWLRTVASSLRMPTRLPWKILLLFLTSVGMAHAANAFLGFNPQAHVTIRWHWATIHPLLWQFPLALPVENLVLLGLLVLGLQVWPRSTYRASIMAAIAFGLLHVPFWGGWVWFPVAASVLPWVLYMRISGDLVAPLAAHLLLDSLAVMMLWPGFVHHAFWIVGVGLGTWLAVTAVFTATLYAVRRGV